MAQALYKPFSPITFGAHCDSHLIPVSTTISVFSVPHFFVEMFFALNCTFEFLLQPGVVWIYIADMLNHCSLITLLAGRYNPFGTVNKIERSRSPLVPLSQCFPLATFHSHHCMLPGQTFHNFSLVYFPLHIHVIILWLLQLYLKLVFSMQQNLVSMR